MYAICVESSHSRGMGHLFRAIVMYRFFSEQFEQVIIVVNNDKKAIEVLRREKIKFHVVESLESDEDWETSFIRVNNVNIWINDRTNTSLRSATRIKNSGAIIITVDDCGDGAELAEINFAPMIFDESIKLKGNKIFRELKYCIISPDVFKYRRNREINSKIAVTFGGSDTHGITEKAIEKLLKMELSATVFLGPSYKDSGRLSDFCKHGFFIKQSVPSLIEALFNFDCVLTSGGVTAMEAAAAGLPSLIIATEEHECFTAKKLEKLGCARYLGFRDEALEHMKIPENTDIKNMSNAGIDAFPSTGIEEMYIGIKSVEVQLIK